LSRVAVCGKVRTVNDEVDRPGRLSRRSFVRLGSAMGLASAFFSVRPVDSAPAAAPRRDPDHVLRDLQDGNRRFASGQALAPRRGPEEWAALAAGQSPSAVVVGCSDSRVPPELVFDQGVGDLFVVRVAGNLVGDAGFKVQGSVEYAVAELGASLIVVLGHTSCGAVKAAVQHAADSGSLPGSIRPLVESLRPAVAEARRHPGDLLDNAIRANVSIGVERLRRLRPILAPAIKRRTLAVVGGVYDLPTGRVTMIA
jgi:carbonic anhydrase